MERENKPADVKLMETGKKLDIFQMGIGGVVALFNPVLGLGIFSFEAGKWYVMNKYVDWRMRGRKQPKAI